MTGVVRASRLKTFSSPTTPTISNCMSPVNLNLTRRPTASSPGKTRSANVRLTRSTGGACASSRSSKARPLTSGHAHHFEVVGADGAQVRLGLLRGGRRTADDVRRARPALARERQVARQRRAAHARHRRDAAQQLVVEARGLAVLAVARGRERDPHRQEVARVEARVNVEHRDEALHQQPRADEQHERERHLRDDEQVAQPLGPRARRCCRGRPPSKPPASPRARPRARASARRARPSAARARRRRAARRG